MKSLILIPLVLVLTFCNVYSQHFNIQDIKPYLFDLPLNSDKSSIIFETKKKFNNTNIDFFIIQTNSKIYFIDSTISYAYFQNTPLFTTLKLCDLWSYSETKATDTTFYIVITASYGTDEKAQIKMLTEYDHFKELFEDNFVKQRPYKMYADGKIGEGISFFLSKKDKIARFNIGWSNGGCFRNYQLTISYRQ